MRAVSLPVNAIIVIALGLLVLVVGASIVVKGGGGFSRVVGTQVSIQECQVLCATIQQQAFMIFENDCSIAANQLSSLTNQYNTKGCESIYTCIVELGSGTKCKVSGGTLTSA